MSNFFARQPVPLTPNPEPPGYDVLRYMLMQRAMGQMMNPYGLSPQGAANFGGFNQGNRPFNPYGQGFGPGGPTGNTPPQMGGGMGGGGSLPPNIMQLLQQIFGGGGANLSGARTMAPAPRRVLPMQGPSPSQVSMPQRVGMQMSPVSTTPNAPRAINPVDQQLGGYDGTTVGYGGFPIRQPQNVMALMRAMGQVPRPHMMAPQQAHPMGAMKMPFGRNR